MQASWPPRPPLSHADGPPRPRPPLPQPPAAVHLCSLCLRHLRLLTLLLLFLVILILILTLLLLLVRLPLLLVRTTVAGDLIHQHGCHTHLGLRFWHSCQTHLRPRTSALPRHAFQPPQPQMPALLSDTSQASDADAPELPHSSMGVGVQSVTRSFASDL